MSVPIPRLYEAMVKLLDKYYSLNPIDDLGSIMGDISTNVFLDGGPADPAVTGDWLKSVHRVVGEHTSSVEIEQGLDVVIDFVETYQRQFGYDISALTDELLRLKSQKHGSYLSWEDWIQCLSDKI